MSHDHGRVGRTPAEPSVVQWPRPLTPAEARALLEEWDAGSRRVDARRLAGEIRTRDSSLVTFRLLLLIEEWDVDAVEVDGISFPHPPIDRRPMQSLAVPRPQVFEDTVEQFVFSDSVRTVRDATCHGRGTVDCATCHGGGQVACQRFEDCVACNGSGVVDSTADGLARPVACFACGGDGRRSCTTCGGSGWQLCTSCGGRRRRLCERCSGRGDMVAGEVVTMRWSVRSERVRVGVEPPSTGREDADARAWSLPGDRLPQGLPPTVGERARPLLATRTGEVLRRLDVELVPVTSVTITGERTTEVTVVGDNAVVVSPPATRRADRLAATALVLALALVVFVLLRM